MTIIVKPRVPETADDLIADYLTDLLGTLSFPSFEAADNGEITLLGTKFYMRIGKFLGQPTQAIIAEGQFVKMQHTTVHYDKNDLKVIDPKDPDSSLYEVGFNIDTQYRTWRPPPPSPQPAPAGFAKPSQGIIGGIAQAQNPYWNNRPPISPAQKAAIQQRLQVEMAMIEVAKQKAAQERIPQIYGTICIEDKPGFWKRVFGGE